MTISMAKTVLIVDDDKLVQRTCELLCKRWGHRVLFADDGDAALRVLGSAGATGVDVIVLDIVMPMKDGFETLLELKRLFPPIKVVVMTGARTNADHNYLTLAQKFGADGTIKKPFPPSLLREIIECTSGGTMARSN